MKLLFKWIQYKMGRNYIITTDYICTIVKRDNRTTMLDTSQLSKISRTCSQKQRNFIDSWVFVRERARARRRFWSYYVAYAGVLLHLSRPVIIGNITHLIAISTVNDDSSRRFKSSSAGARNGLIQQLTQLNFRWILLDILCIYINCTLSRIKSR